MKRIEVAAAVIRQDDKICLSRRPQHVHQGGKWEFPGGKIEPGESVVAALSRELQEELGITPMAVEPLIEINHNYPDKSVCLKVMTVTQFQGEPKGVEGQEVRWVPASQLQQYQFPAANVAIVSAALLPRSYVISPMIEGRLDDFMRGLESVAEQGHELIQIRCKDVTESQWRQLLPQLDGLKTQCALRFLLNSAIPWSAPEDLFDGLHLTSGDLLAANGRPTGYPWVSASCHNLDQLNRAAQLGLDFVTLSPYNATASHPQTPPIDRQQFQEWVAAATVPVYALGGVGMEHVHEVCACGAQGVAGIGAFWHH